MAKYQVKCKLVKGKLKYGIVDECLNVVKSFTYDQIIEKDGVQILKCEDRPDEVFYNGKTVIEEKDGLYNLELISGGNGSYWLYFKAQKHSNEYGIIMVDEDGQVKDVKYPFGKADQIVIDQGRVLLYKEMKTKTGKGVWHDPNLGTLNPVYEDFAYRDIDLSFYPKMPDPCRVFVDRGVEWYFRHDKFSRKVEFMTYSKKISGKNKHGIMVKKYDEKDTSYDPVYTYQNFISGKDSIRMDQEHQYFVCENIKRGKKSIDLIPYMYDWEIYTKGAVVYGKPTLMIPFQFEEEFEDFCFIPNSPYLKAKVNGKWGVFEIVLPRDNSPYDHKGSYYQKVIDFCYEDAKDIEYCSNYQFILKDGEKKKVVQFYKDTFYSNGLHQKSFVSDSYPNVEGFHNGYQVTMENGEKKYGIFHRQYENGGYIFDFVVSEKGYLKLARYGNIIQGFTGLEDGHVKFDIINDSNEVIANDAVKFLPSRPKEDITECLLANGNTVFLDKNFEKLSVAEDVDSYVYYYDLRLFDITHSDGTHSFVPSSRMNMQQKEALAPILGTHDTVFIGRNYEDSAIYTVIVSKKTEDSRQPYCVQEYCFECSSWDFSIRDFHKIFDGNVVECYPLPEIKRTIFTVFDSKNDKNVSGVIENQKGNIALPFDFDSITYDADMDQEGCFIGWIGDDKTYFDKDGYYIPELNGHLEKKIGSLSEKKND